jgi:hypothetical protein
MRQEKGPIHYAVSPKTLEDSAPQRVSVSREKVGVFQNDYLTGERRETLFQPSTKNLGI